MKINTKIRYGLRTIIHLAKADDNGILQKQIAASQNISIKYLDAIISALKAYGLIRNVSGKRSGYVLTKSPDEITVFDIYAAFEHKLCIIDCLYTNGICDREPICQARDFWSDLNNTIESKMRSTKMSDLI